MSSQPASRPADPPPAPVEPAAPEVLRSLLPDHIGTLPRGEIDAGIRSIGEMRSSVAQAPYEGGEGGHASVKIVDYIAMPGLFESVAPWQNLDLDRHTDADYSRTIKVGPYRALESYTTQTRSGSLALVVAKRFVVTIEVTGLPPETMRETAKAMKLATLDALARD